MCTALALKSLTSNQDPLARVDLPISAAPPSAAGTCAKWMLPSRHDLYHLSASRGEPALPAKSSTASHDCHLHSAITIICNGTINHHHHRCRDHQGPGSVFYIVFIFSCHVIPPRPHQHHIISGDDDDEDDDDDQFAFAAGSKAEASLWGQGCFVALLLEVKFKGLPKWHKKLPTPCRAKSLPP